MREEAKPGIATSVRLTVELNERVRKEIDQGAARSLNEFIVARLQEYFDRKDGKRA